MCPSHTVIIMSKLIQYRGAVYRPAAPGDPADAAPPHAMVEAAKSFLYHYVDLVMAKQRDPHLDDEVVDHQVDVALEAWNDWAGLAFNQALKEMELVENK